MKTARRVSGEVVEPAEGLYRPPAPPKPPSAAAVLLARTIGYVVAWALVLGLGMAACSAMTAPHGPERTYVAPTLPPLPTMAPATPPAPTRTPKPHKTAPPSLAPGVAPVYDCGGLDPADPEIDPEYDCEDVTP